MELKNIYKKDICREIKGVVKVGQETEDIIYQELDEYVVTDELLKYIDKFFANYDKSIDYRTDKMGAWISGFFGSGKSHFLKILSYILENKEVKGKKTIEFFEEKIKDRDILELIKKASSVPADVILFNIDAKSSENSTTKDSILSVFEKVFNQIQGYSSVAYIANFERELDKRGKLEEFKNEFKDISGTEWEIGRNELLLSQDDIVDALVKVLGMSIESARNYIDKLEDSYSISIEEFAIKVKEYLEKKENNHHIVFLVDEIGQYIGDDSKLMLNLQTITEQLGIQCGGRAWVIVTSQQAIDEVTKVVGDDFSKITGRFDTRLSFSSSNVDEVIKKRLLEKTDSANDALKILYKSNESVLKNLITFKDSAEMKSYVDENNFADIYPFIPYQFKLLQSVFNAIRQHGAAGKHLSEGERSLLGAFKETAMKFIDKELGVLVPIPAFYDTIEQFLEHNIRIVINGAINNDRLNDYDVEILKLLFMIKYIKEIPANIENLATLMVNNINNDKIEIKNNITESLRRLEKETLIQKNGEEYIFLTNEEQDINREIKNMNISMEDELKAIYQLVFEDIIGIKKFRYKNKYDFSFNMFVDNCRYNAKEESIGVKILTSFEEKDENTIRIESSSDSNVTILLNINTLINEDLENVLKLEAYLRQKSSIEKTDEVEMIIRGKNREVEKTKERLRQELIEALKQATIFVKGDKIEIREKEPVERLYDALVILVKRIYNKLDYIVTYTDRKGINELFFEDNSQIELENAEDLNERAYKEIETQLDIWFKQMLPITIISIFNKFKNAPYGWYEEDIMAIIVRLLKDEKIRIQLNGEVLLSTERNTLDALLSRQNYERIRVEARKKLDINLLNNVKSIAKSVFNRSNLMDDEDTLKLQFQEILKNELSVLNNLMGRYYGNRKYQYPCKNELEKYERLLKEISSIRDTEDFYNKIAEENNNIIELSEKVERVKGFFNNQVEIFDKMSKKIEVFNNNEKYTTYNDEIKNIANQIIEILKMPEPFSRIPELAMLDGEYVNLIVNFLEEKAKPIIEKAEQYRLELVKELEEKDLTDKYLKNFNDRFHYIKEDLTTANELEKIFADEKWLEKTKSDCYAMINAEEKRKIEIEKKKQEEQGKTEEEIENVVKVKPTKYLKASDVIPKVKTIRNKDDIECVVNEFRNKLIKALEDGNEIKLV